MEEIIAKHTKKIMENHKELSAEEARKVAEQFYLLSKIAIDSFRSSNSPLIIDKATQNVKV